MESHSLSRAIRQPSTMAQVTNNVHDKDPDAIKTYAVNWADFLEAGVTITGSTWDVPDGITKVSDSLTTPNTYIRLSGGTVGDKYTITNHVVMSNADEDDVSLLLRIVEQ